MPHNFKLKDLEVLSQNGALDNHPDFAKVWRDLERGAMIVSVTDDFAWFPERYEFLGYIRHARTILQSCAAQQLAAVEHYPQPRVKLATITTPLAAS